MDNETLTGLAHHRTGRATGRDAMAKFSLRQAAQQAGVSKSTILRAIQSGRLSADRLDGGGYAIDSSELHRVYGDRPAQRTGTGTEGRDAMASGPGGPPEETAAMKAEIDGLRAQLALMREHTDDIKEQRDGWQRQAEAAQRLLADQRPARRGWFGWGE